MLIAMQIILWLPAEDSLNQYGDTIYFVCQRTGKAVLAMALPEINLFLLKTPLFLG